MTSNYITDFKGVWNNYLSFIKKDNELFNEYAKKKVISKDMLIMQALHQEEFSWLGNIPLDKIKKLREEGEMDEMREILGKNLDEIKESKDDEFIEVISQIRYSLNQRFKKHETEVKYLDKMYRKKYSIRAAPLIVSGSLLIVSAIYPPIASIVDLPAKIAGGLSIYPIITDFLNKREKLESLQRKPIAMLFDAKKAATD